MVDVDVFVCLCEIVVELLLCICEIFCFNCLEGLIYVEVVRCLEIFDSLV